MRKITSFFATGLIVLTGCSSAKESIRQDEVVLKEERKNITRTEQVIDQHDVSADTVTDQSDTSQTTYRNGSYIADGSYTVHNGEIFEDIDFSFVLEDDIITAFNLVGEAAHPDSVYHQKDFMTTATPHVVGSKIADLDIDVVAGSSATTEGFRKALQDVKDQALKVNPIAENK